MSSLYQLTQEFSEFQNLIEQGAIPEEAISDTLQALNLEIESKIEGIALVIKNALAEEKALGEEIKALQERKKSKTATAERLKAYLLQELQALDKQKIETARVVVTVAKNPPSLKIADEEKFKEWAIKNKHDQWLTFVEPTLNKNAIKEAISGGEEIEGASLQQGEGVRIK